MCSAHIKVAEIPVYLSSVDSCIDLPWHECHWYLYQLQLKKKGFGSMILGSFGSHREKNMEYSDTRNPYETFRQSHIGFLVGYFLSAVLLHQLAISRSCKYVSQLALAEFLVESSKKIQKPIFYQENFFVNELMF